jgi:hypothetical protein
MAAYTLKEAWQLGWRLRVKCNTVDGRKEAHRNKGLDCHSVHEPDMKTLVWTRGNISIQEMQKRLRCPACGNREILVYWEVPNEPAAVAARGRIAEDDWRDEGN